MSAYLLPLLLFTFCLMFSGAVGQVHLQTIQMTSTLSDPASERGQAKNLFGTADLVKCQQRLSLKDVIPTSFFQQNLSAKHSNHAESTFPSRTIIVRNQKTERFAGGLRSIERHIAHSFMDIAGALLAQGNCMRFLVRDRGK
jgi:hypothetical protein